MNRQLHIGGIEKAVLLARLRAAGVLLNPLAEALFADKRFTTSPTPTPVEIAQVNVAALGLTTGGTFVQIVEQAEARGLSLCPLELGPHLRLALPGQPESFLGQPASQNRAPPGSITVASPELCADESVPKGFYLRRVEGVLWLRGYRSWAGHIWNAEDEFVFLRPSRAA